MNLICKITDCMFYPMVYGKPSILQLTVSFLDDSTSTINVEGSIEYLQKRFGFIVNGDNYDLRGLAGRNCEVEKEGLYKYHFVRFID